MKTKTDKIKLTNVIVAKYIANNLISLRVFADAGFGIYLDDSKLKIFEKKTGRGETCLLGEYVKPN